MVGRVFSHHHSSHHFAVGLLHTLGLLGVLHLTDDLDVVGVDLLQLGGAGVPGELVGDGEVVGPVKYLDTAVSAESLPLVWLNTKTENLLHTGERYAGPVPDSVQDPKSCFSQLHYRVRLEVTYSPGLCLRLSLRDKSFILIEFSLSQEQFSLS